MNKILLIILIFIFNHTNGQENQRIEKESGLIEFYLITDYCNENTDWNEKKECSKTELLKRIRKKLNNDLTVKTDNSILKKEFERISKYLGNDFHIISENGNRIKQKINLPIDIATLK